MDGATYPPNPRLRREREVRNWTLETAARELRTLMASHGETQIGINFNAVSRWERGVRRPGKRYRHYLCLLYGKRSDELGFLPTECADLAEFTSRTPEKTEQPQGLVSRDPQPSPSVNDGHATQPRCTESELEDLDITRRQLLAASGLLVAAAGAGTAADAAEWLAEPLERAARVASGRAAADDALITELSSITASYERAYSKAPATMLVTPGRDHVQLVKHMLDQPLLPEQREALLRTGSRMTARMAMLHFFDLGDQATARRLLRDSITMGEETHDPGMHVFGLLQAAQHYNYSGEGDKSVQLLEHARTLAERACTPNAVSWVLAVQAEAYATLRQPAECSRLLGQAEAIQPRSRPGYEPSWSERWSRRHVAGFIGAVHMRIERPGPARAALHEVLAGQDVSAVKYRSINLVDLATTYAQDLDVEQACELAGAALNIAGPMNFGTTLERMSTLRRRLGRWKGHRSVRELDDQLRTLSPAGPSGHRGTPPA